MAILTFKNKIFTQNIFYTQVTTIFSKLILYSCKEIYCPKVFVTFFLLLSWHIYIHTLVISLIHFCELFIFKIKPIMLVTCPHHFHKGLMIDGRTITLHFQSNFQSSYQVIQNLSIKTNIHSWWRKLPSSTSFTPKVKI